MDNVRSIKAASSRYSQLRLTVSFRPGWQGESWFADYRLAGKPFHVPWDERQTILLGSTGLPARPSGLADTYECFEAVAGLIRWAPEISGAE